MSTLWIDGSTGVTAELLLGALSDAGVPTAVLQDAVDAALPGVALLVTRAARGADGPATATAVETLTAATAPLRRPEVVRALEGAGLDDGARRRALAALQRLTDVAAGGDPARGDGPAGSAPVGEGSAGGPALPVEQVALVLAVCAGLGALGVQAVVLSPVALGPGPGHAPAPALLRLAQGWDVLPGRPGARTTTTGLALVTTPADRPGSLPALRVRASGVGAVPGGDGVLQVVVGDEVPDDVGRAHAVVVEANVDDLDPRLWPDVVAALLAAGASDAWLTPILMKKGRPAHTVHVLCPPALLERVGDVLWRHTTTLGWRATPVAKHVLDRTWVEVTTDAGPVRVKLGVRDGVVVQAMPEYEDVRRAAEDAGVPVRDVLADAHAAAHRAGLRPGAPAP